MQTRKGSLVESVISTAVGFVVAMIIQLTVPPMFGAKLEFHQDLTIVGVFTLASVIRQYVLRRVFNHLTVRKYQYESPRSRH